MRLSRAFSDLEHGQPCQSIWTLSSCLFVPFRGWLTFRLLGIGTFFFFKFHLKQSEQKKTQLNSLSVRRQNKKDTGAATYLSAVVTEGREGDVLGRLTFRVSVCQGARLFIVALGAARQDSGWEGVRDRRVEGDGKVVVGWGLGIVCNWQNWKGKVHCILCNQHHGVVQFIESLPRVYSNSCTNWAHRILFINEDCQDCSLKWGTEICLSGGP